METIVQAGEAGRAGLPEDGKEKFEKFPAKELVKFLFVNFGITVTESDPLILWAFIFSVFFENKSKAVIKEIDDSVEASITELKSEIAQTKLQFDKEFANLIQVLQTAGDLFVTELAKLSDDKTEAIADAIIEKVGDKLVERFKLSIKGEA